MATDSAVDISLCLFDSCVDPQGGSSTDLRIEAACLGFCMIGMSNIRFLCVFAEDLCSYLKLKANRDPPLELT